MPRTVRPESRILLLLYSVGYVQRQDREAFKKPVLCLTAWNDKVSITIILYFVLDKKCSDDWTNDNNYVNEVAKEKVKLHAPQQTCSKGSNKADGLFYWAGVCIVNLFFNSLLRTPWMLPKCFECQITSPSPLFHILSSYPDTFYLNCSKAFLISGHPVSNHQYQTLITLSV